jgi:hypothetical protein
MLQRKERYLRIFGVHQQLRYFNQITVGGRKGGDRERVRVLAVGSRIDVIVAPPPWLQIEGVEWGVGWIKLDGGWRRLVEENGAGGWRLEAMKMSQKWKMAGETKGGSHHHLFREVQARGDPLHDDPWRQKWLMGLSNFSVSPSSHKHVFGRFSTGTLEKPKEHACPLSSWRVVDDSIGGRDRQTNESHHLPVSPPALSLLCPLVLLSFESLSNGPLAASQPLIDGDQTSSCINNEPEVDAERVVTRNQRVIKTQSYVKIVSAKMLIKISSYTHTHTKRIYQSWDSVGRYK